MRNMHRTTTIRSAPVNSRRVGGVVARGFVPHGTTLRAESKDTDKDTEREETPPVYDGSAPS